MEKISYYSLNNYLRDTFGCKVYKVSLNAGFTCPNRDGRIDTRGCIFCSKGGSGEFAGKPMLSLTEQLKQGKQLISSKLPKDETVKYIGYFQAYTNTYAPVEVLRMKYEEVMADPDVVAISIATRPDCLSLEVLDLLEELNRTKPVWVELGLQTIHEASAKYIRRGYELPVYDRAVSELTKRGIYVVTHVIIGLLGETKEDMLMTVKYVADSPVKGIKLQLLHVLKDTDLATDYEEGKFDVLSMEEYIDIVKDCLRILPPDMVVHRLTGDGDKKILIAPQWSKDKKRVLNALKSSVNSLCQLTKIIEK